jgi:hypothetical protein
VSAPFEARWPTECGECGWRIVRGSLARYNQHGEVVHAVCPDAGPLRAVGEVCGSCFQEKAANGSCGCDA